jgi:hypothetical protein
VRSKSNISSIPENELLSEPFSDRGDSPPQRLSTSAPALTSNMDSADSTSSVATVDTQLRHNGARSWNAHTYTGNSGYQQQQLQQAGRRRTSRDVVEALEQPLRRGSASMSTVNNSTSSSTGSSGSNQQYQSSSSSN